MPYKEKKQRNEAVRRFRQKGITTAGITGNTKDIIVIPKGTTLGVVGTTLTSYFRDGIEMVPAEGILPERPRFLSLSDRQVLDRANFPKPDLSKLNSANIQAFRNLNTGFTPLSKDREKTLRELKVAIK